MGNMGYAMLKGSLKDFSPSKILFSDVNRERMESVSGETGVEYVTSNAECVNRSKYIVLAVKPQFFDEVLKSIENVVTENHVIISIAPGITIQQIKDKIGFNARVVRAMPNTPALVGEGMTGVAYNSEEYSEEEIEVITKLFNSIGKMKVVSEKLMSAVVCASGLTGLCIYVY